MLRTPLDLSRCFFLRIRIEIGIVLTLLRIDILSQPVLIIIAAPSRGADAIIAQIVANDCDNDSRVSSEPVER